ncbi:phage portal protein [Nesterenkonia sp. AY15]|uniref:phage portal protein n=1 Tax=Nesterenkonia sp. AY15 TaxID=2901139 RepID=UPI001F4D19C0|nr:phage portal protein [Nesterenkonia sp. AY15]MCH8570336.1 phage portal protein [Nesterenkonia sp. AY15]
MIIKPAVSKDAEPGTAKSTGTTSTGSGPGFTDCFRAVDTTGPGGPGRCRPRTPAHIWASQPSVRKVVDFLATQAASTPMVLLQQRADNDTRTIRDGDAYRVLKKPHPLMTSYMLWRNVMIDRLLYDAALVIYVHGELRRVPPHMFEIRSDAFGVVREVRVHENGESVDVTDIPKVLLYGWHPDTAGGVSPLHTLAAILDEAQRSVQWRSRLWENSPKMSGLLTRPADAKRWDAEQKQAFVEAWRSWASGEKAGGTPILENGMEYQPMTGLTPLDAQDIEGRRLTDVEVATFFGVPPEMLGIRAGKFAGLNAYRETLYGAVLGPWCVELEQAFNSQLLPHLDTRDGVALKLDRDGMVAGTFLEKARTAQVLTGAPVMTRAEGRDLLNLPHIPDTDELITPMNLTQEGGD